MRGTSTITFLLRINLSFDRSQGEAQDAENLSDLIQEIFGEIEVYNVVFKVKSIEIQFY